MKYIKNWIKVFTLFIFTILFTIELNAVNIELSGTITEEIGDGNRTSCLVGERYRVPTTTTYDGTILDLLVTIVAEDNEYDTYIGGTSGSFCIDVRLSSGIQLLHTRLRDDDIGDNRAFMDLNITIVEKDTNITVPVDRIVFTAFDLDINSRSNTELNTSSDNVYLISPSQAYLDINSLVSYNEGAYGSFDIFLEGNKIAGAPGTSASGNCTDDPGSVQPACRAGGVSVIGAGGPNTVTSMALRVENTNAYGQRTAAGGSRVIDISFREVDFNSLLGNHVDHGDINASYGDAFYTDVNVSTVLGFGYPADSESSQFSSSAALDDDDTNTSSPNFDDEDGVRIGSQPTVSSELNMTVGNTYDLNVTTIGTGYLSAWVDLNGDGDFADTDEQVLADEFLSSTIATETIISLVLPSSSYTGVSYARFRFSGTSGISFSGDGVRGEVEDYKLLFNPAGNVIGHLYSDTNGDGTQNVGEADLAGVTVIVTSGNGEVKIVITDVNGDYNATDISTDGNATVDIDESTLPAGVTQIEGTDPTQVVVVADIDNFEENNGFDLPPVGNIIGHLYNDLDGDGTLDPGEPGLIGITIQITDVNGTIFTVTTDANGDYRANNIAVGGVASVNIDETTLPAGSTQTGGGDPTNVSPVEGSDTFEEDNGFSIPNDATIGIAKTSSTAGGPVVAGDTITYTIIVTNSGTSILNNVIVNDMLPAGVTYDTGTAMKTYPQSTGAVTTTTYEDTTSQAFSIGDAIYSCPTEYGVSINVPDTFYITDLDVGFNFSTSHKEDFDVWVTSPQGTRVKILFADIGRAGSPDNFDVLLDSESGNTNASLYNNDHNTNAPFYDVGGLPANSLDIFDGEVAIGNWIVSFCDTHGDRVATYNRARLDFTYNARANTTNTALAPTNMVTVGNNVDLFPGETLTVVYDVTVDADGTSPILFNTVSTSTSETNTSTATTADSVTLFADLVSVKSVDNSTPDEGDTIVYTITVTNNGPAGTTNVELNDTLPSGVTYVSHTTTLGSYNSGTGIWDIGNLANGTMVTLSLSAIVD